MVDYIIVGSGLAGIAFAETVFANHMTVKVFDNNSQNSSQIAAGLYNPVILKRFSQVWQANEQLAMLSVFYKNIEEKLAIVCDYKIPIYRKFFSVEEQNNWFIASDKPNLTPYLSATVCNRKFKCIDSPFGFGEVLHTGFVDTSHLLEQYHAYLEKENLLERVSFDYSEIKFDTDFVIYKSIKARHIVFAEGFGMHGNPYFNYLPLDGTKGEILIIKAPLLDLDIILNTSVYFLPLGNGLFKVGATYNWDDKTNFTTEAGKLELITRIQEVLSCEFEIISHFAGVRPTVKDRKPLIGTHSIYKRLHILNGLGTRGVMLGPAMAKDLFDFIEYGKQFDKSIDIKRYAEKDF